VLPAGVARSSSDDNAFSRTSKGGKDIKRRRNIAENYNRLSSVHERYRETDKQTDRETDDRQTGDNIYVHVR